MNYCYLTMSLCCTHSGGIYPGFPGSRYPFSAKDERSDDHNGDYYATQRLSHMPHSSPCSSPHNLHGGTPNIHNVHHMHSKLSNAVRVGRVEDELCRYLRL
jgi:hypothetical protein